MSKVFIVVFLIFGTVVGSGFSSGREILVYFSRFGTLSYVYIALASIMFFALFRFFLIKGKVVVDTLQRSRVLNFCVIFCCLIFCSSMFAGVSNLFSYLPTWLYVLFLLLVLLCCFFVTMKGLRGVEKINQFIMPICSILFLAVLVFCAVMPSSLTFASNSLVGFLFCPLYVGLNCCMSGFVISGVSEGMTKKQCNLTSFLCTLMIFVFLTLGNFVLLQHGDSYDAQMPFLFLASSHFAIFVLADAVIFIGCFTTLISLCYTLKVALQKEIKNGTTCACFAVFVPFLLSILGFSSIVSFLYPICSVVGIFTLLYLLFST